jgi:hypothetical protein
VFVAVRICEGYSATFEVGKELRCETGFREVILLKGAIDGPHDIDVLLPSGEEGLNVGCFAQGPSQRSGELGWFLKARLRGASARIECSGPPRLSTIVAPRLPHPTPVGIVKGQAERIAERSEGPLCRVGLRRLQRKIMGLSST